MNIRQKYDWSKEVSIDNKVFPADQLDRAKYAGYLTSYLSSFKSERHFVLNINSGWGTGKTYFIKRWHYEVKNEHPAVYVDAWKQDFSDDPLLATVSSIISQLQQQCGNDEESISSRSLAKAIGLFKTAAPIVTKAIVKKATGIAIEELSDKLAEEDGKKESSDVGQSDIAAKFVESLLKDHEKKLKSIDHFKDTIQEWIGAVIGRSGQKGPAFIFIDELDRCRPNYAVEMLEMIKHLFSMKGVIFVISTDTDQLQHSIKIVYGNDFNAESYLGRFFNRRVEFKMMPRKKLIMSSVSFGSLYSSIEGNPCIWPYYQTKESIVGALSIIFDGFSINARDVDKILDQLQSIVSQKFDNKVVDILFCACLLCLRQSNSRLFELIQNNQVLALPSVDQIEKYKLKEELAFKSTDEIAIETFNDNYGRFIISNQKAGRVNVLKVRINEVFTKRLGKGSSLDLVLNRGNSGKPEKPNYFIVTNTSYVIATKEEHFELITMACMLES